MQKCSGRHVADRKAVLGMTKDKLLKSEVPIFEVG